MILVSHSGWNLKDENEGLGRGHTLRASSRLSSPFLLQGASALPYSDTHEDEKSEDKGGCCLPLCFPWGPQPNGSGLFESQLPLSKCPCGSDGKEYACNAGDLGSSPWSGRSPREGNGSPLQYSCLENPRAEEPGGLQSTGSQRVRHDWVTNTSLSSFYTCLVRGAGWEVAQIRE